MLKTIAKKTIYWSAEFSRFNQMLRYQKRHRLLVLCYHSVIPDSIPEDPRTVIAVTATQFEDHLRELKRYWHPISEVHLLKSIQEEVPLPNHSVLITFDDGFKNNADYAAPLLKKYEIPAVFFLTAGLIGTNKLLWTQELTERILSSEDTHFPIPSGHSSCDLPTGSHERLALSRKIISECKKLPDTQRREYLAKTQKHQLNLVESWQHILYDFMTWEEIRSINRDGFSIGAHTLDYPILTSLNQQELRHQLAESKAMIEKEVREPCHSLAYPNGSREDYNENVMKIAEKEGYQLGYTLCEDRNPVSLRPMEINRICITRDVPIELFKAKLAGWR